MDKNSIDKKNNLIWVEKYRPSNINKIIQNDEIKQLLACKTNLNDLPHLLFYGSPGTGKTTTAHAICKYIFSQNKNYIDIYSKIKKERILELNASDERGIKVVREKIKTFASQALHNYDNLPYFKIIILDESDVLTNDSQFALRRIMEQYSHITRFILICNYVTKIIPPLSSRCSKYRFNPISIDSMKTIVENILSEENIKYNNIDKLIENLYNFSNGDLRKSITLLQRASYISRLNNIIVCDKLIADTASLIPIDLINNLYDILTNRLDDYHDLTIKLKFILNNGYSANDLLNEISKKILNDNRFNDKIKSNIFLKIANISNLLSLGSDVNIQILYICSYINNCLFI
jgi:replication factor C subunit 2/4